MQVAMSNTILTKKKKNAEGAASKTLNQVLQNLQSPEKATCVWKHTKAGNFIVPDKE